MATFNAQSGFTEDPETGCVRGYNDYEQCRANFFMKQQNEILKNQSSKQNVSNNENEGAKVMGATTEVQAQPATNNLAAIETATGGFYPSITYIAVLLVVVIATVITTRYFTKKKEDEMQVVFFRKNPIKHNEQDNEHNKN